MLGLCNGKLQTCGLWTGFAVVSGLVFYLSWLPRPQLADQVPMPGLLSAWVDSAAYENLRTAVPFLLLGMLAGGGLRWRQHRCQVWIYHWLLMVVIAIVAEGGQLLIPARTCDPADIGWASVGAALGLGMAGTIGHISRPATPRGTGSPEDELETPAP